jgi:cation diffusion facilitator CzcD-associated flavoprotein CzcO
LTTSSSWRSQTASAAFWRENHYLGAACDVPSHLYSYSFAPRAEWPDKFARQADILDYLNDCARFYGLEPHIRFSAAISEARWDNASSGWWVRTNDGRGFEAQALVTATGQLNRPSIPPLPGLDRFAGAAFHSAEWPQHLDLRGKRVAVIGTGASAIQIVSEIAPDVARLSLFQRSGGLRSAQNGQEISALAADPVQAISPAAQAQPRLHLHPARGAGLCPRHLARGNAHQARGLFPPPATRCERC